MAKSKRSRLQCYKTPQTKQCKWWFATLVDDGLYNYKQHKKRRSLRDISESFVDISKDDDNNNENINISLSKTVNYYINKIK